MGLVEWRPMRRNSLRGFAAVELPSGLTIIDVSVHVTAGRAWAGLPSRPMLGSDGAALRDEKGKIRYLPLLRWRDRDLGDRFSAAVVGLVRTEHPGALDDKDAP
jgi:hypothetical protein